MASDLKVKIEKLMGASNWAKWKWQMNMHFEQYDLTSIVNGSQLCPVVLAGSTTVASDIKIQAQWKRDNAKAAALIASALSPSVSDLVLTYTNASDIWEKLVSVYEQSNIQRLSLLMTEFFNLKRDPQLDVAAYVAKVEKLFSDMNTELRRRGSHDIPDELLHGQILATVGREYQEFSNVWESLEDSKRTTNNLLEKLCTIEKRIQSTVTVADNSAFVAHRSTSKEVGKPIGEREQKKKNKIRYCFHCGKAGHMKKQCRKLLQDKSETNNSSSSATKPTSREHTGAFFAGSTNTNADWWVCDSGASHHMTANKQYFSTYKSFPIPMEISMANKSKILAYGSGRVNVDMLVDGKWISSYMEEVWYAPEMGSHLFSVRQAVKHGVSVKMEHDQVMFYRDGNLVATGVWSMNTYKMNMKIMIPQNPVQINMVTETDVLQVWHERMGHQDKRHIREVLKSTGVNVKPVETTYFCDGCALGKAHRKPFRQRMDRPQIIGELIHADVNGPMSVPSIKGAHYFVLFKDDYSKYRRVFFVRHKNEVAKCLKIFLNEVSTSGHRVKKFRCDGGREFDCDETRTVLNEHGILMMLSAPYTPEQNGAAERENRTIVELARSMMSVSGVPKFLWEQACETAVYLLNRTGKSSIPEKSPMEMWNDHKMTNFNHLRIFGTDCYVHIPKLFRKKFDNKSVFGKMVGYLNDGDGYQIYIPSLRKIVNSHDIYFKPEKVCTTEIGEVSLNLESSWLESPAIKEDPKAEDLSDYSSSDDSESEDSVTTSRVKRNIKMPIRLKDYVVNTAYSAVAENKDPISFKDALHSNNKNEWLSAMEEELEALAENKTWTLVNRPENKKIIRNRWVLRTKLNTDGSVQKYRARLVAKGCSQKAGIDYGETFSPVARYDTIRAILAVSAVEGLKLSQFDVKTAFLYGSLQEEIHMEQPEGFNDGSGRVCKLNRSLYGLKQAPRCWNARFINFMMDLQFKISTADPCLFIRQRNGKKLIVGLYVDDGLIAGSDQREIDEFICNLQRHFKITFGPLGNFLGMQIETKEDGIFVYQSAYAQRVLQRFNMDEASPVSTPSDRSDGGKNDAIKNSIPYREAVGCLIYMAAATRPDIAFSVSCVARAMENPTSADWLHVKRILKYIKGTKDYGLHFQAGIDKERLEVFSDADFAGDGKSRRSTSGVVAIYAGGAVSWSSQLQRSVALSTTEAEFVAASEGAKEVIWLKRLLGEIAFNMNKLPVLRVDNASAVKLIKNPEFHKRSKHIEVRYYFVRECYQKNLMMVEHIDGQSQLADILTKPLDRTKFVRLRNLIGVQITREENFKSSLGGSVRR